MRKRKDSLTKVIFLSWLTTIIGLSIIFILFIIYYKKNDFEGTSASLNKAHLESYERSLQSNVDNNLQLIDYIISVTIKGPITENVDIVSLRKKVLAKINSIPSLGFAKSNLVIISPEREILVHGVNKSNIGEKIGFINEKGIDISDSIIRMSKNPKGKSFSCFKEIGDNRSSAKVFLFAKKHPQLDIIVFSEIPYSQLDSGIRMNLERLKINIYIEMGFAGLIFIVLIGITILYMYRLSKSIRSELINILTFINNTNDKKVYNSFAPEKFQFREFEKIGQCNLLLVKQVNKLLKRLSQEAIESETASQSKSSLFAGFSHDFLVELNTIMGMSQVMLKSDLPEKDKEKINKIFHSSSNIASMLRNLETTSLFADSHEDFKQENMDVKQIFGEAIQFIEHEANANDIEFKYNIDEKIPEHCIGDPIQIRQLIINILRNAISFNDKGTVDLKLNSDTKEDKVKLTFEAENSGEGFLGTELNEIQSFPNARPKYSMLSLRVAVCNFIASKLDAKFELLSVKGEGTSYKLTLPLTLGDEPEKVKPAEEIEKLSSGDPGNKTILIVEDEPANRELLAELMQSSGYDVKTATNGQEAVDIFKKEDKINLILMDCQMPVLNGFKATREIRKTDKGKDVTIVAITGCTSPADKKECFEAGMNDFIAKPYDIPDLLEMIKKFMK